MKKRRSSIIVFVLVAALCLGIGYAALADDLFVTGSANISVEHAEDAFAEDIYFSRAVMNAEAGTAVIGADEHGEASDKVTITVADGALKGKDDYVICNLEIKNAGDIDATITMGGMTGLDTEYFEVTTSWGATTTQNIPAGATLDIVYTIKCIKTPTTAVSTNFSVTFQAKTVDSGV